MTETRRTTPSVFHPAIVMVLVACAVIVASVVAFPRIEDSYIAQSKADGESRLRLVSGAINQAVEQYKPVPTLIADDPILRDLLRDTDNQGLFPFVNEKLRQFALSLNASEIYLLDTEGTTIAASNYRKETSFLGQNFAYRPYFQMAVKGETSLFHALGTTSGERGFFFSAPILDGITVLGVLTVKVTVDAFESAWIDAPVDIMVADSNGIVFLSGSEEYRLRSLVPLTDGIRQRISETKQFPLQALTQIPFSANVIAPNSVEVVLGEPGSEVRYLSDSVSLSLPGWHAIVLTPLDPIRRDVAYAVVLLDLVIIAIGLALLVLIQRRARVVERMRDAQAQQVILEQKVRERTSDLDDANVSLRAEITERRTAEERLRKTQSDLVQAGKLAALGQMSAALSHEINQPLAAVKSYADNARAYIERGRVDEASDNILRISDMTDRMAKISHHLRNFARQPGEKLRAIEVHDCVREAIAILAPQLRQSGVEVSFDPSKPEVWALGGKLRLQQVLVNVMTNANDAMAGQSNKRISLDVDEDDEGVHIHVRDVGPGLPDDALDQIFEAFFTTKQAGSGMGLGLSISYNIIEDFGGKLTAVNRPGGGGHFTITLRRAEQEKSRANLVAE